MTTKELRQPTGITKFDLERWLAGEIDSAKTIRILNLDGTSYLFKVWFVNGASVDGILYRPGIFGPNYEWELGDDIMGGN